MKNEPNRFFFLDQLRVILVSIVIFLNMSGTFGQMTPWFVKIGQPDEITRFVSGWFVGIMRPWLLGVFFLVIGALAAKIYEAKSKHFTVDRLMRLGIPSLVYIALVNPALVFLGKQGSVGFSEFTQQWATLKVIGTGPLWFAIILLLVSLSYALFRKFGDLKPLRFPSTSGLILFGLILSATTFVLRLWIPVGTYIWGFHIAFLPQFFAMTVLGLFAYKSGWLEKTTSGQFWTSLILSIACIAIWPLISSPSFDGGFSIQSAIRTLWESILLISASFVCIHSARMWLNRQTKLWCFLTENGYGVYVLHAIVLVAVALTLGNIGFHPLAMWLFLSALCVPLTFATAWLVRMIPGVKKVL